MMTTAIHSQLAAEITDTLIRLRDARADGDPNHQSANCTGCLICIAERKLNRLVDQLPRREPR